MSQPNMQSLGPELSMENPTTTESGGMMSPTSDEFINKSRSSFTSANNENPWWEVSLGPLGARNKMLD